MNIKEISIVAKLTLIQVQGIVWNRDGVGMESLLFVGLVCFFIILLLVTSGCLFYLNCICCWLQLKMIFVYSLFQRNVSPILLTLQVAGVIDPATSDDVSNAFWPQVLAFKYKITS